LGQRPGVLEGKSIQRIARRRTAICYIDCNTPHCITPLEPGLSAFRPRTVRPPIAGGPALTPPVARPLAEAWAEHRSFLAVVVAYVAAGLAAERWLGLKGMMDQLWFGQTFLLYYALLFYSALLVVAALRWRIRTSADEPGAGRAAWRSAFAAFRGRYALSSYGAGVLLVSLAIPVFMNAFGSWKSAIPRLHPYTWDPALVSLDRTLHFGSDPWRVLQPLIATPFITVVLDLAYGLFVPIQVGVVLWQTWSTDRPLRARFFLAYVLVWALLGTLVAIALASGGPCFYGRLTGLDDPFRPLTNYLTTVSATYHLQALDLQQMLWLNYTHSLGEPFAGISAMPSLHVGMPVLFTLIGWRTDRRLGVIFLAYTILSFLGSVHLGWHYAVDGYASAAGVGAIWLFAGWLTRREQRPVGPQAV